MSKKFRFTQITLLVAMILSMINCDTKNVLGPEETLEFTVYTTADGLNYDLIYDIAIDSLDRIWIATWWGINVFDGQKWDTIDASDGLPYENARVLHFDHQGNLWIGSGGNGNGLVKFDGTTFTHYTTSDGLSDNSIESIGSQPDGTIWVGTSSGGACKFDGIQWFCYDTNYVNWYQVLSIYAESDSSVWFGTSDGVTHFDGKSWAKYFFREDTAPNGLHYPKVIWAIDFDQRGTGWFGFPQGIYMYCGREFHIKTFGDFESVGISDITDDDIGNVWFSSYSKGTYRYHNGMWTNYSTEAGLPTTWVSSVEVDSRGGIWFGTQEGLVKLTVGSN